MIKLAMLMLVYFWTSQTLQLNPVIPYSIKLWNNTCPGKINSEAHLNIKKFDYSL